MTSVLTDFTYEKEDVIEAREDLATAILDAYKAGMSQEEIERLVEEMIEGFTLAIHDALYPTEEDRAKVEQLYNTVPGYQPTPIVESWIKYFANS